NATEFGNIDFNVFHVPIARYICYGNTAVPIEFGFNCTNRCFNFMSSRTDAAQVFKSFDQPDGAVSTHTEIADIVKKDNSRSRPLIGRLEKQSTYNGIMAARFTDYCGPQVVVIATKDIQPLLH